MLYTGQCMMYTVECIMYMYYVYIYMCVFRSNIYIYIMYYIMWDTD